MIAARVHSRVFLTALWACLGLNASAQNLSASKLSAHLINAYTAGASNIVSGGPRVLKVLGLDSGFPSAMTQALRDYKTRFPAGSTVVRIYSPKNYALTDDPTASAGDFWTNILQKGLGYLSPSDRALIDYLEGPNEGQTPTLGYPNASAAQALQASQWFNQFWTNLLPRIVAAGCKPCIGSIAVGNPGGTTAQMQSYLEAFVPALRQAKAAGGAWSYHAYTINYTTDIPTELSYSLRYRQFYGYFAVVHPELTNLPLLLTEGGVDQTGTPATSGWQARGPAGWYQRWLNWFDNQLQQDPYVMGCTIFEIGNPESWGWPSFDLEPLAGWMRIYLLPPTMVPPAATGVSANPCNGGVALTWTNIPLNPTTWNIKRSTTSGGPYLLLASNVTAGVSAETYSDLSTAAGVRYYYVVSASNAFGESPDSPPVSAQATNALPDLVVTAVTWTPTNIFPGSHVVFSSRALNQGSAATPAGSTLGVGFNLDGLGTASWYSSTFSLPPGGAATLTANGGPNGYNYWAATTPGLHTVIATVDDVNRIPESNDNNNALSAAFMVFAARYAINSGGGAAGAFSADSNFIGSTNTLSVTNTIDVTGAVNPAPAAVYQSERLGEFSYLLNNLVPGSNYTLRLHLAEIAPAVNNPGERQFNISVDGLPVLTDFDVLASAGGKYRALTRVVQKVADSSGTMQIQFSTGSAGVPACNGIEAFGSVPPSQAPVITSLELTNGYARLVWQATPAAIYQVQCRNELAAPFWSTVGTIVAGGTVASFSDPVAGDTRYYRVLLVR